jgi:hypothetical protein
LVFLQPNPVCSILWRQSLYKVAIVRSNSFLYDPMLPEIVRSLSRKYSITNVTHEIITETGCGIFGITQIRNALAVLKDNHTLRVKLENNGGKAFVGSYNRPKMEESLYRIYDELLRK